MHLQTIRLVRQAEVCPHLVWGTAKACGTASAICWESARAGGCGLSGLSVTSAQLAVTARLWLILRPQSFQDTLTPA